MDSTISSALASMLYPQDYLTAPGLTMGELDRRRIDSLNGALVYDPVNNPGRSAVSAEDLATVQMNTLNSAQQSGGLRGGNTLLPTQPTQDFSNMPAGGYQSGPLNRPTPPALTQMQNAMPTLSSNVMSSMPVADRSVIKPEAPPITPWDDLKKWGAY